VLTISPSNEELTWAYFFAVHVRGWASVEKQLPRRFRSSHCRFDVVFVVNVISSGAWMSHDLVVFDLAKCQKLQVNLLYLSVPVLHCDSGRRNSTGLEIVNDPLSHSLANSNFLSAGKRVCNSFSITLRCHISRRVPLMLVSVKCQRHLMSNPIKRWLLIVILIYFKHIQ